MAKRLPPQAYQLKITIKGFKPPIWRRILVSDQITLLELHAIIQVVFGWTNSHLHQFEINDVFYGDPDDDEAGWDEPSWLETIPEWDARLKSLGLREGQRFSYVYDFGDEWDHSVLVEKIHPKEKGQPLPICIKGKRAGPPEDSSGPGGYENRIVAYNDPNHQEHHEALEWLGEDFDPEAFDLEAVNQYLRTMPGSDWVDPPADFKMDGINSTLSAAIDPDLMKEIFSEENSASAETVIMRRNAVMLLSYLKENNVPATKTAGNLSRKAVKELALRFVHRDPEYANDFAGMIDLIRNEEDFWPLYLLHVILNTAGLIDDEHGKRWRVTALGESFLVSPPLLQVGALLYTWLREVNWGLVEGHTRLNDDGIDLLASVAPDLLSKLPVEQDMPYDIFVDQILQNTGWNGPTNLPESFRGIIRRDIELLVVRPMEDFGVLNALCETKDPSRDWDKSVISISLTKLGQLLLAPE
jgi:hypothetical protein